MGEDLHQSDAQRSVTAVNVGDVLRFLRDRKAHRSKKRDSGIPLRTTDSADKAASAVLEDIAGRDSRTHSTQAEKKNDGGCCPRGAC